ncbi:MAG: thioesterase domain-containing protein, partial [Pirellulaceae bacterium]|nr:thioesterase domain-containing protein [Pirellulaceae bacterium]
TRLNVERTLLEQGMDSLMIVELRTIVERELAIELPMRLLTSSPTVAAIAAHLHGELSLDEIGRRDSKPRSLLGESHGADGQQRQSQPTPYTDVEPAGHIGSRVLVRLQPEGNETPLFFVPAGYGDLLAFQDIAKMLGFDYPVYGLQPPGAKNVKAIQHMSIYRLISRYIAEIKKVQPHGPYRLTGYSAGAVIAVELARELVRKGDQIEVLVMLDPPVRVPRWLDGFYRLAYRFCEGTHLLALVRRFRWRPLRHFFHAILDEGLRTHTAVTAGHVTAMFPGRIAYFRARNSWVPMLSYWRTRRYWTRVAEEGAEVHWIPGSHYGMLRGTNAEALAEELRDCLQRS